MDLKSTIRTIPDWPKEKIMFRDITTLLQNRDAFKESCDLLYDHYKGYAIDKIAGIDARGFLFASVIAYRLNTGIVPVRKKGKLPYKTISESYSLEYGENIIEIHEDSVTKGEKILIIDDLLATGGTVKAAVNLIERLGGQVVSCGFVIELPDLNGRDLLRNYDIFSLISFEGE